jgi:hypothetical protein
MRNTSQAEGVLALNCITLLEQKACRLVECKMFPFIDGIKLCSKPLNRV